MPSVPAVPDWLRELPGPVVMTYEAGPTGYGLARGLTEAGIRFTRYLFHTRSCH